MDENIAMGKEGVRVGSFMEASTEVKENQYLTASGIKFFQKQTAGNNCPICMTDRLNVRLRATEIRLG